MEVRSWKVPMGRVPRRTSRKCRSMALAILEPALGVRVGQGVRLEAGRVGRAELQDTAFVLHGARFLLLFALPTVTAKTSKPIEL